MKIITQRKWVGARLYWTKEIIQEIRVIQIHRNKGREPGMVDKEVNVTNSTTVCLLSLLLSVSLKDIKLHKVICVFEFLTYIKVVYNHNRTKEGRIDLYRSSIFISQLSSL